MNRKKNKIYFLNEVEIIANDKKQGFRSVFKIQYLFTFEIFFAKFNLTAKQTM